MTPSSSRPPGTPAAQDAVCEHCARRTWLLGRLAGHIEVERHRLDALLALDDEELLAAVASRRREGLHGEWLAFDPETAARARDREGIDAVCRCHPDYPRSLHDLPNPPAVLHVAGGRARLAQLLASGTVAIVGTRTPSPYGREAAHALAEQCARAGLTVISGLALGIDGRAHAGALSALGGTLAVLPAGADHATPATHRGLYARLRRNGVGVSELGSGVQPRRWMFPARNRIIAALAAMTVVVQAKGESGALITARWARSLGRPVGAVPGSISSELAAGPHGLLREGAQLVAEGSDVLHALFGADADLRPPPPRPRLQDAAEALLAAFAEGAASDAAFAAAGLDTATGLQMLTELELTGVLRRGSAGAWEVRR